MTLIIKKFVKHPLKNNNYLVADDNTNKAILIDCSSPDDEIIQWATSQGFKVQYILLTHGHVDHVLGVNYHLEKYGIQSYLYRPDLALIEHQNEYLDMLRLPRTDKPKVIPFDQNKTFNLGDHTIQVIPTPGHTNGSVCYLIEENLFSGDTLFHKTYGRTDLPEGNEAAMQRSLQLLFKTLPDETIIYSGHGETTTLAKERPLYQ